jgi:IS5 family transposase
LSVTARRWTKKHGKSFYGYKNHVNADAKHKLIRRYEVTDASVHDSRKFDGLLNQANASATWAACAAAFINARAAIIRYRRRSRMRTAKRAKFGLVSSTCSALTSPGGRIVRTIGIVRAKARIGLQNVAHNIRRLVTPERIAAT